MAKTYPHDKRPSPRPRQTSGIWVAGLIFALVLLLMGLPHAYSSQAPNPSKDPPGLSNPFSRGLQRILGISNLAAWIGSRQLEKEIHKKVDGDVEVDLIPYSATDLAEGKVRRLHIQGKNLLYDKAFYATAFELHTDEDTPLWIDLDSGKLKSVVEANVLIRIQETDLNRSLVTEAMKKQLGSIKVPLLGVGSQRVALLEPRVTFKPERLMLNTRLGITGAPTDRGVPLQLETGFEPQPGTGMVRLKNLEIAPIEGVANVAPIRKLVEDAFQWILVPEKLIPMKGARFDVQTLDIHPDGLILKGHMRLVPNAG